MQIVDIIVSLWWIYAIASAALIWCAFSMAKERANRACDEWEAMMIGRKSDSEPVPETPKFRVWDIHAYYWIGATFGILAFLCAALKLLELVAVTCLSVQ